MWNPFKSKPPEKIEQKSHSVNVSEAMSAFLRVGYNGTTASSALSIYTSTSAVFIPVDLISEAFSSIDPVLQVGDEIITDHPVLDKLKRPNPFFTKKSFFKGMSVEKLVTGEAFPVAVGNIARPPLELWNISPKNITINESSNGTPHSYAITGQTLTGNYRQVSDKSNVRFIASNGLQEIAHIRGYSTRNNSLLRAQSPLVAASQEARQHILGNMHNVNLLEKGGRMMLNFGFEDDMAEDDFKDAQRRIRAQYGGASGETIGVTAGGKMKIEQLSSNNVDMDFGNLQKMAMHACFLTYRVPLALLTVDAATLDNYRQAMIALYDLAVLPLADSIFEGLTELLFPRYGLDPTNAKITYDPKKITALASRTLDELGKRVALNLETDNELRPILGRAKIGTDGDVIRKPVNMIPISDEIFTIDERLDGK